MPHTTRDYHGLIGRSRPMQKVYDRIAKFGPPGIPVLILGETGTGKDLCARALWEVSGSQKPYVAVNCAAFPDTLIDSELFGHERGAFTGAIRQHAGIVEQANGGTLFLDEVMDLPAYTQAKLLRVIETGEYRRIGGERVIRSRFRLVAATSHDPDSVAADKKFRADLLHRLGAARIGMPPLRCRLEDLPPLARAFLEAYRLRNHGKCPARITEGAMELMLDSQWPGNVRQLSNVVETAAALCCGRSIGAAHVAEALPGESEQPSSIVESTLRLADALRRTERRVIREALRQEAGNRGRAAEQLGVSVSTLHRKLAVLRKTRDMLDSEPVT